MSLPVKSVHTETARHAYSSIMKNYGGIEESTKYYHAGRIVVKNAYALRKGFRWSGTNGKFEIVDVKDVKGEMMYGFTRVDKPGKTYYSSKKDLSFDIHMARNSFKNEKEMKEREAASKLTEEKENNRKKAESSIKSELKDLKARRKELIENYGSNGSKHAYNSVMGGLNPASIELDRVRNKIKKLEEEVKKEKSGNQIISVTKKNPYLYEVKTKEFNAQIGKFGTLYFIIKDGHTLKGDYNTMSGAKEAILNIK